jgi:hypothetical protein
VHAPERVSVCVSPSFRAPGGRRSRSASLISTYRLSSAERPGIPPCCRRAAGGFEVACALEVSHHRSPQVCQRVSYRRSRSLEDLITLWSQTRSCRIRRRCRDTMHI